MEELYNERLCPGGPVLSVDLSSNSVLSSRCYGEVDYLPAGVNFTCYDLGDFSGGKCVEVVCSSDNDVYELDADVYVPGEAFDALQPVQRVLTDGSDISYKCSKSVPNELLSLEQCVSVLEGSIPLKLDAIIPSGSELVFIEAGYLEHGHSVELGVRCRVYDEEESVEKVRYETPDIMMDVKRTIEQETSATLK